ncbi:hypothetical protein D6C98_02115 [Aureobasidium pullulans]|uniref:Rhodopsin domain-containing protein n=1 Tax=Aureobasidium pullulans TaxID=5580 RepID=A0A4S9ZDY0_AURPU|nr:hypothetical protein D6D23_10338 [Aureobasidium pullulans]THW67384.1 hypothetical protein D6D20_00567 [Aureobasidium pullulans]THX12674.1 hypothetical protein D6D18_00343 [Aureobasidium pullulans]THY09984.1 hypothetical protein D6D03_00165 [Aureobasidium pullulans]THY61035.1 hypothetical protein D6C98_02115 [Aureobasidium pullulans]
MGSYNSDGFYAFSPVTANDRAGILYVATILSLLFSVITLLVRWHIQRRTFGLDFWIIVAATIVGLGQYAAVFVGLDNYDLGKAVSLMSESDQLNAARSAIASICLFIIANALSKCSVIFFMKRLFSTDNRTARILCNSLLGLVAVWTLASILALTITCGPSTKFALQDRCSGQITRWSLVATFDSLFEIAIFLLSILLVVPLQMTREIKLSVVFAFSFRLIVAMFAIIHVYYVSQWSDSSDPGIATVYSLLWQQVELGYALMAATIPTLRSFVRAYEKAMGWESSYYIRNTNTRTANSTYQLSTMNKSRHEEEGVFGLQRETTCDKHPLRPDRPNYKAQIYGPGLNDLPENMPRRTKSNSSGGSEEPIIRKDVEIQVSSEAAH